MHIRILLFTLLILASCSISFGQKIFEGKVTGTNTYSNIPENMKPYLANSTYTTYYKNNKTRTELINASSKITLIEDHEKNVRLTVTDMTTSGIVIKSATINHLISPAIDGLYNEKIEEYKMILDNKCQKVISTCIVNGKETKTTMYVNNSYTANFALLPSGPMYFSLPFEVNTNLGAGVGDMTMQVTSYSEEPISDELFDLTPPKGFKVQDYINDPKLVKMMAEANAKARMDARANPTPINTQNNPVVTTAPAAKPKTTYDTFSDTELKKMLDEALAKEDYDAAQAIKDETDKRKKNASTKYGQYSITDLNKMLDDAVKKEDYTAAQEIKAEIGNREKK